MSDRTIIVTGGAGFIGSHTCKQLARSGYMPVAVDNLQTGHADSVKWGPLERIDIRDTSALSALFDRVRPLAVVHFAASAYVGESVKNPGLYYDNNVGGMVSLLEACCGASIDKMVFSSSCATYGIPASNPISETTPQTPINPYGRTKLICEQMLADYHAAFGLNSVSLRYFNAAGADADGELREKHDPETHLLPLALLAAAGKRPALDVFGTDYPTPDGTCIRDYIHVFDLAAAHVAALHHLEAGKDSVALNLGTGKGHSILEIAAEIERISGRALPWNPAPRRPGDPPELVADIARAHEILGFEPEYPTMRQILQHAAPSFGLEVLDDLCI